MRAFLLLHVVLLAAGCAHAPALRTAFEVELALDEGRASERPLIPGRVFEMLVRYDPKLAAWRPLRMRFRLAQPGPIAWTVYRADEAGRPAEVLARFERRYGPELVAAADEGKWIVEELPPLPALRGPILVGLYGPEREGDARLWATPNRSGAVVQRELDGTLSVVPRTPVLRLDLAPEP